MWIRTIWYGWKKMFKFKFVLFSQIILNIVYEVQNILYKVTTSEKNVIQYKKGNTSIMLNQLNLKHYSESRDLMDTPSKQLGILDYVISTPQSRHILSMCEVVWHLHIYLPFCLQIKTVSHKWAAGSARQKKNRKCINNSDYKNKFAIDPHLVDN